MKILVKDCRKTYLKPQCDMLSAEISNFICTSTTPDPENSGSGNWDSDSNHEGGSGYIGGDDDVAPAKPFTQIWDSNL